MVISRKSQKSGDDSVNLQAENITINTGLTIAHVKEIALDVFEDNFNKLAGVAKETADNRAKEITEQFLSELVSNNPEGLEVAEDPDFQYSLFHVQKEYARCGDKELGDILVDILVDRSKEEGRSLLQIVLNESLTVAPKLNAIQLDIISCFFNIVYTQDNDVGNLEGFREYINNAVLVFADAIGEKDSNYQHINYVGCATVRSVSIDILEALMIRYKAVFVKGFKVELLYDISEECPQILKVLIPCKHNESLFQARGLNDDAIKEMCREEGISENHTNKLIDITNQHMMNSDEATEFLNSICPKFEKFLEDVQKTRFKNLELTSVGIAIAHAHSRKKAGFDADLSMWI